MRKTILASLVLLATTAFAQSAANSAAQPKAIIHTSMGDIHCVLFPDKAPIGTTNFIGLATGTKEWTNPRTGKTMTGVPLYDGTIFHRVIPQFMIQGGDPLGSGTGDPGYKFKNETTSELKFDRPGRLAYANAGPNTNGSQFFITEVPYASLNGGYTIFGQCEDAEIVQRIARVQRSSDDKPFTPVKIKHIEIVEGGAPASPTAAPAAKPSK